MLLAIVGMASIGVVRAETDKPAVQPSSPAEKSVPAEKPGPSYDDEELQRFVVAALEVQRIKASYAPKLAEKLREQQAMREAASQEMKDAVQKQGLSVDRYQEMLVNVQLDPKLAEKVDKLLEKEAPQKDGKAPQSPANPKAPGGEAPERAKEL